MANVPEETLSTAEREAGWMFSKADIEVSWVGCPLPRRERAGNQVCKQTADPLLFVFSIVDSAPNADIEESTLGFALPFTATANHAAALYSKINELANQQSVEVHYLLAHVIAHEVAHLLFRSFRHGDGIMRAKWTDEDLQLMRQRSLPFTRQQSHELIHGLKQRLKAALTSSRGNGSGTELLVSDINGRNYVQ